MIDSHFRQTYQILAVDPVISLIKHQVKPAHITALALATGLSIVPLLYLGWNFLAFIFLLISGYLDTLDGSLAREQACANSKGAVLDIVSDRTVEAAIVIGLYLVDPFSRGLLCLLMLSSILICVSSFLVAGIFTQNESQKSFHYSPGIIERAEAFILFGLMLLFPNWFTMIGCVFVLLVTLTAIIRVWQFQRQS